MAANHEESSVSAAVTVPEHAEEIVKTAIGLRSNLNCHRFLLLYAP